MGSLWGCASCDRGDEGINLLAQGSRVLEPRNEMGWQIAVAALRTEDRADDAARVDVLAASVGVGLSPNGLTVRPNLGVSLPSIHFKK